MNGIDGVPHVPVTDLLYRRAAACRYPLSTTFELSPLCNFNCRMCYVRKSAEEVAESPRPCLRLENFQRLARDAREAGTLYLLLTGGEPFLWPGFWPLYEELADMGMLVSVNTNGSLIDRAAVKRLKKRPPKQINITLYGAGDETYERLCGVKNAYSRVREAISMLTEAEISVKLNCSLTPYNAADLEAMMAYAEQMHLRIDVTTYMFPPIRKSAAMTGRNDARFTPEQAAAYRLEVFRRQSTPEQYEQLLRQVREGTIPPPGLDEHCVDPADGKIRCRAGKATSWITWDGYMTPCGLMPEPRADIAALPFGEAWKQLTEQCDRIHLSGTCDACPNLGICHPCAAMAFAETGRPEGIPKYLCETTRALRELAFAGSKK